MENNRQLTSSSKKKHALEIEGYPVEGLSIGGRETCVIFPSLSIAFDIGRCPQGAISQEFLFISHGHMDHIGGLPMYIATRSMYKLKPPTIFVPIDIKGLVEELLEVHRSMDQSELKNSLIGLNIGEEFQLRRDLKVKAFRTYHVIPSQGYIVYSVKQKLKEEYAGLSGIDLKKLKCSGVEITYTVISPEIAFTGDTTSDFIVDPDNADVMKARILVLESTFIDNAMTVENARDYGHTHLFEIAGYADRFHNKAILLIHFSARYEAEEIQAAVSAMPPSLAGRVCALFEGQLKAAEDKTRAAAEETRTTRVALCCAEVLSQELSDKLKVSEDRSQKLTAEVGDLEYELQKVEHHAGSYQDWSGKLLAEFNSWNLKLLKMLQDAEQVKLYNDWIGTQNNYAQGPDPTFDPSSKFFERKRQRELLQAEAERKAAAEAERKAAAEAQVPQDEVVPESQKVVAPESQKDLVVPLAGDVVGEAGQDSSVPLTTPHVEGV